MRDVLPPGSWVEEPGEDFRANTEITDEMLREVVPEAWLTNPEPEPV